MTLMLHEMLMGESKNTGFSLVPSSRMGSTTNASTRTFTNIPIGNADTSRLVIVGFGGKISGATNKTTTGVTIGGVTATKIVENAVLAQSVFSIYAAIVPAGTTATFVFNYTGTVIGFQGEVYTIYNKSAVTAFATGFTSSPAATSGTLNLNVPANGVGVAIGMWEGPSSNNMFTWNASYTEVSDWTIGNPYTFSAAYSEQPSATTLTTSFTTAPTTGAHNLVAASWAY